MIGWMNVFRRNKVKPLIPNWMRLLFPILKGIENNPLFIRLSGQGYCGRLRWWRAFHPPETQSATWMGINPLILILLVIPGALVALGSLLAPLARNNPGLKILAGMMGGVGVLCLIIGVPMAAARMLGIGGAPAVERFMNNGASQWWGKALYLTFLQPKDYDQALFGALLYKHVRLLTRVILISLIIFELYLYMGLIVPRFLPNHLIYVAKPSDMIILFFGPFLLAGLLWIDGVMITALNLSASFHVSMEFALSGRIGSLLIFIVVITFQLVPALAGGFAVVLVFFAWAVPLHLLLDMPVTYALAFFTIFVLAHTWAMWATVRFIQNKSFGELGRAFLHRIVHQDKK